MKKVLFFIILVLTAFTSLHAVDFTYEGITYTIMDEDAKTVRTTAGSSASKPGNTFEGELVLPEKVYNGDVEYTLKQIGKYGFNNLTAVTIPASVNAIKERAFYNCDLKSVTIADGDNKLNIETSAFKFGTSPSLEKGYSLYLGRDIQIADKGIFNYATEVKFGSKIKSIPEYTFCYYLQSGSYDHGYQYYYYGALLKDIVIPGNIKSIGDYAFYDDKSDFTINSVIIKDGVENIGARAFFRSQNMIENVRIEDGLDILNYDYSSFNKVTNFYMGRNWIDNNEYYLFLYGGGPINIEFGPMITEIPDETLRFCSLLEQVVFSDNLKKIGNQAFYSCSNLYSVKIGKSCLTIGQQSFADCPKLRIVTSLNPEPPTLVSTSFDATTRRTAQLFIPYGTTMVYKQANYWTDFINVYELDEEVIDPGTGNDSPGFSDENITDYVMMEIDQEMNFSDLLPSDLTATAWMTSNDDIVDITKKGKAEAYEFGHVYISAKDSDDKVIAVFSVFVCPTVTIVHGDGVIYTHHVLYNSHPTLMFTAPNGYEFAGISHDQEDVTDLVSEDGKYIPTEPITANSVINIALQNTGNGPTTGAGSVLNDPNIRILVNGHTINIVGVPANTVVRMYNMKGDLLFNQRNYPDIEVIDAGIYIIEIVGQPNTYKVVIR